MREKLGFFSLILLGLAVVVVTVVLVRRANSFEDRVKSIQEQEEMTEENTVKNAE